MSGVESTQKACEPTVRVDKEDGVAVFTLNRPGARNAVNAALSSALGEALEDFEADPKLRVGILTGAGPAFCAGADLKALGAGEPITAHGHPEWGFAGLVRHEISKPLIAAVNGFALGGGTEILLACDLAVLSEDASLGFPEVRRGLFAAAGGLIRMPRQVPTKIVMELALTGVAMDARDALRWGLVNRVVPPERVMVEAFELAQTVALNAPWLCGPARRSCAARPRPAQRGTPECGICRTRSSRGSLPATMHRRAPAPSSRNARRHGAAPDYVRVRTSLRPSKIGLALLQKGPDCL